MNIAVPHYNLEGPLVPSPDGCDLTYVCSVRAGRFVARCCTACHTTATEHNPTGKAEEHSVVDAIAPHVHGRKGVPALAIPSNDDANHWLRLRHLLLVPLLDALGAGCVTTRRLESRRAWESISPTAQRDPLPRSMNVNLALPDPTALSCHGDTLHEDD